MDDIPRHYLLHWNSWVTDITQPSHKDQLTSLILLKSWSTDTTDPLTKLIHWDCLSAWPDLVILLIHWCEWSTNSADLTRQLIHSGCWSMYKNDPLTPHIHWYSYTVHHCDEGSTNIADPLRERSTESWFAEIANPDTTDPLKTFIWWRLNPWYIWSRHWLFTKAADPLT